MDEYLRKPLEPDGTVLTQRQWFERLSRRSPVVTDNEVLEALDAVRESRDQALLAAFRGREHDNPRYRKCGFLR